MVNDAPNPDKKLPVIELFGPTIQGEGAVIGQQTYFLRMGLCDYKCTLCDSLHAVLPNLVKQNATWLTQEQIAEKVLEFRKPHTTPWITISGGNPCIHDLTDLVALLQEGGMHVHVETQGTLYPNWLADVDLLTISPKGPGMGIITNMNELDIFMSRAYNDDVIDALKIVVFDQRDLDFARFVFDRYLQMGWVIPGQIYLSLGNPYPPIVEGEDKQITHLEHMTSLLTQYRVLCEDIMNDRILSQTCFLPQWHVFVWGNDQGH